MAPEGDAPRIAPPAPGDPTPASIDALFAEWDHPTSPGCALGVFRDGAVVYHQGYGMANLDWGIPIEPSTVFYVASISKQFVAASIALLDRRGTLSLDDDIRRYLPELPPYPRPVTIRHLIHHTGGIPGLFRSQLDSGYGMYTPLPVEEALAVLADKPLDFEPSERFAYSNGGYFLLSLIVERASEKSLKQFARVEIFEPLGMVDSHFHDDSGHIVERRAMSYQVHGATDEVRQNYVSSFNRVGSGGLYTTLGDLAKWDQNFYDERVGGPGFTDTLSTRGTLDSGEVLDYAYGLVHMEYRGHPVVDHSGFLMGFRADLLRFPGQHFSVAVLCNSANIDPSELARRVADLYLADVLEVEEP